MKSLTAEMKARGQLTIPKKIRDLVRLEEGQPVSVIPMGDAVVISPRRLELDEARRALRRLLKQTGCSVDSLVAELEEERDGLFQELYGPAGD